MSFKIKKAFLFFFIPIYFGRTSGIICNRQVVDFFKKKQIVKEAIFPNSNQDLDNKFLQRISTVEKEVFSEWYLKSGRFIRFYLGDETLVSATGEALQFHIYFTFFNNGVGCFLILTRLEGLYEPNEILDYVCYLQGMPSEYRQTNKNQTFDFDFFIDKLEKWRKKIAQTLKLLGVIVSGGEANVTRGFRDIRREIFPYYVIFSTDPDIDDTKEFHKKYTRYLYALTCLDYTGWYRTKDEKMKVALGEDFSRREDYSLFITKNGSIELESVKRLNRIQSWAKSKGIEFEEELMDVVLERVITIETLLSQRCLLEALNLALSIKRGSRSIKEEMIQHAKLRRLLAQLLDEYYNVEVQNKLHISGIEWIEKGKEALRINKLYATLCERLESFQLSEGQIINEQQGRLSMYLLLISLFLSAVASSQIIDLLLGIEFIKNYIADYSYLFKLMLFTIFIATPLYLYLRIYRRVEKD
jgi:hypothetical protein